MIIMENINKNSVQICIIKPNNFNINKLPKLEKKRKEIKD